MNAGFAKHNVRTKAPNELGLYDMSGNCREWCWDWYGDYTAEAQKNPTGASSGRSRVIRGGCYEMGDYYCKYTTRDQNVPAFAMLSTGFRVVRSIR